MSYEVRPGLFPFLLSGAVSLLAACAPPRAGEDVASTQSASVSSAYVCTALRDAQPGSPQVFFAPFDATEEEAECVLESATREVVIAHYNIRSERMIRKLIELKARGVAVRVAVDQANAANEWNTGDDALEAAGIPVVRTRPSAQAIMHLKVAVVDGAVAMTGSFNWNDTAAHANDENMLVLREPELVARYRNQVLEVLGEQPRRREAAQATPSAAVYFAPEERLDAVVVKEIDAATSSVDVAMFTFTMATIKSSLQRALARGVKVRLVAEKKQDELSSIDDELARAGALVVKAANRIAEHSAMHQKYAVLDGRKVITGATNWTLSGTRKNEEDLLVLDSPEIARKFGRNFADLLHVYAAHDVTNAAPGLARASAPIFFHVVHPSTSYGDRVVLVGSDPSLGSWDPLQGVDVGTSAESFPGWTARAQIPAGARLEYKLVTRKANGAVEWEPGDNRVLDVPATGRASVVSHVFGDTRSRWTPSDAP